MCINIDPKHYKAHNYLIYCNDVLVSILKFADSKKLNSGQLIFDKDKLEEYEKLRDGDVGKLFDWAIEKGCKAQVYDLFFKHIFLSLVKSFWNYMSESVACAAKLKIDVSYTLLRKPLKEILGCIEWLYVDRDKFIDLLYKGPIKDL